MSSWRQPEIRYAETPDGASVAYAVAGSGPALLYMPVSVLLPLIHMQRQEPPGRPATDRLTGMRTVVRYDSRGSGLSSRDRYDYTVDGLVEETEAVVAALGLRRFDLFGAFQGGATAIAYAARHPEQVSRMVLYAAIPRPLVDDSAAAAMRALSDLDWETFSETYARVELQFEGAIARAVAAVVRESTSLDAHRAFERAGKGRDVTDSLPLVQAPTLVLTRAQHPLRLAAAQEIAARIPHARLGILEGGVRVVDDDVLQALIDFLAEEDAPADLAAAEDAGPPYPDGLSAREVEVLRLVAMGASNPEIAEKLVISINTVTSHLTSVYRKTETNNRVEATRYAIERRLTE